MDNLYGSLSSRIAENLFWLGRYAERSEGPSARKGKFDCCEKSLRDGLTPIARMINRISTNVAG